MNNIVVVIHLVFGTLPVLLVVWAVGAVMMLFAMLRGVFYGTSIWQAHRSAYNALTQYRIHIVNHLQRLPLGFFQERKVGDLVNIINHDVEQIEPVVKAFSHEETRTGQVLGGMCDYIRWVKHSMFNITLPMALITMFLEGGIVVMTLVGLSLMSSGELTVTRFIIALILGGLFSSSFSKLATFQHFAGFNLVVSLFVEYVKGIPVLKIFGIKVKDSYGRISRFLNAPVVR